MDVLPRFRMNPPCTDSGPAVCERNRAGRKHRYMREDLRLGLSFSVCRFLTLNLTLLVCRLRKRRWQSRSLHSSAQSAERIFKTLRTERTLQSSSGSGSPPCDPQCLQRCCCRRGISPDNHPARGSPLGWGASARRPRMGRGSSAGGAFAYAAPPSFAMIERQCARIRAQFLAAA